MKILCWEINKIGFRPQKAWKWYVRHNFIRAAIDEYLRTPALDKDDPERRAKATFTIHIYRKEWNSKLLDPMEFLKLKSIKD